LAVVTAVFAAECADCGAARSQVQRRSHWPQGADAGAVTVTALAFLFAL
jgi:hypothetical protein